jgi:hypothetical protein
MSLRLKNVAIYSAVTMIAFIVASTSVKTFCLYFLKLLILIILSDFAKEKVLDLK